MKKTVGREMGSIFQPFIQWEGCAQGEQRESHLRDARTVLVMQAVSGHSFVGYCYLIMIKLDVQGLSAGCILAGGRFVAAGAFEISDASLQLSGALFLQQENLAFEISEVGSLRGLHIFKIFGGLEASEELFGHPEDMSRARIRDRRGQLCIEHRVWLRAVCREWCAHGCPMRLVASTALKKCWVASSPFS